MWKGGRGCYWYVSYGSWDPGSCSGGSASGSGTAGCSTNGTGGSGAAGSSISGTGGSGAAGGISGAPYEQVEGPPFLEPVA